MSAKLATNDLEAFWMPFTANRQYKKAPRLFVRAEGMYFTTDDGRGPYWLVAEGAAWDEINAPLRNSGGGPYGRVRLVVEGELSAPGRYGHMGAYTHELRVTRVLETRLIEADGPPSGS